jgi:phage terminase large subunit GpA-like protein
MKIVIYSLNEVVTKFIYWKKKFIDTLNDTSKENTTKSYTNFVLQKLPLKDGGKHIYAKVL